MRTPETGCVTAWSGRAGGLGPKEPEAPPYEGAFR